MRYVPKDSSFILYTDSINSLWNNLEPHLRNFFIEKKQAEELSVFKKKLLEIKEELNKLQVPIDSLDSLHKYGINTDRGIIFAVDGNIKEIEDIKLLLIVPINQVEAELFADFLSKITGEEGNTVEKLFVDERDYNVSCYSGLFTVSPKPGLVLLSNHKDTLHKSIAQHISNLSYYRNNDAFLNGLRSVVSPLYSFATKILIFWRPNNVPNLQYLTAGLFVVPDRLSIKIRTVLEIGSFRFLRNLTSSFNNKPVTINNLHEDTRALLTVKDPSLSYYLKFLRKYGIPNVSKKMQEFFGGVLLELENIDSSNEATLAVVGYREGTPDLLLGITGERKKLKKIIFKIQRKKRLERDKEIIKKASEKILKEDGSLPKDSLSEIQNRGFLKVEKEPLWDKYIIRDGEIVQDDLQLTDFVGNSRYIYKTRKFTCYYLLPPTTENDLEYRYSQSELEKLDKESLLSDRYRLCAKFKNGILWIATDGDTLEKILTKKGNINNNTNYNTVASLLSEDNLKTRFYINMGKIIDDGLLNPESTLDKWLKMFLIDVGEYPSIMFDLFPYENKNEIWISGELIKRGALK